MRYINALFVCATLSLVSMNLRASESIPELEKNNNWQVRISNSQKVQMPVFITLKSAGNHWEVAGIFASPPQIDTDSDLELFKVSRDLQLWANYYLDVREDCNRFEVKESKEKSVCTSQLAGRNASFGLARVILGSGNTTPVAYKDALVEAVIHSIRPAQAEKMLNEFELH